MFRTPHPLATLLALLIGLLSVGCPAEPDGFGVADGDDDTDSGDDDSATGDDDTEPDDDDAVPDDDDDVVPDDDDGAPDDDDGAPDDDDAGGTFVVSGFVLDVQDGAGVGSVTVALMSDPSVSTSTDGSGNYTLTLDGGPEFETMVSLADRLDSVVPFDATIQTDQETGLFHPMMESSWLNMLMGFLGSSYQPDKGNVMVFLHLVGGGLGPVGSQITLGSDHDGSLRIGPTPPQAGDTWTDETIKVLFGGVDVGPTTLLVTTPGGEVCSGRSEFDVAADTLTAVTLMCD